MFCAVEKKRTFFHCLAIKYSQIQHIKLGTKGGSYEVIHSDRRIYIASKRFVPFSQCFRQVFNPVIREVHKNARLDIFAGFLDELYLGRERGFSSIARAGHSGASSSVREHVVS